MEDVMDMLINIDNIQNNHDYENMMNNIINKAMETLEKKIIINVISPVVISGDIHGNYEDIKFITKKFIDLYKKNNGIKLLFLGDYVDRGPHSLKVLLFLLYLKNRFPLNIFLLRGNHETEISLNYEYSLYGDLQKIFDKYNRTDYLYDYYDKFKIIFKILPIVAVVDGMYFCVHGGIPIPLDNKSNINSYIALRSSYLPDIYNFSSYLNDSNNKYNDENFGIVKLIFQMLWADPDNKTSDTAYLDNPYSEYGDPYYEYRNYHTSDTILYEYSEPYITQNSDTNEICSNDVNVVFYYNISPEDNYIVNEDENEDEDDNDEYPAYYSYYKQIDSNEHRGGNNKTDDNISSYFTINNERLMSIANKDKDTTIYRFNKNAAELFCSELHFKYIIRGHQYVPNGIDVSLNNRVITVFTSSKYTGHDNMGCLLYINSYNDDSENVCKNLNLQDTFINSCKCIDVKINRDDRDHKMLFAFLKS